MRFSEGLEEKKNRRAEYLIVVCQLFLKKVGALQVLQQIRIQRQTTLISPCPDVTVYA